MSADMELYVFSDNTANHTLIKHLTDANGYPGDIYHEILEASVDGIWFCAFSSIKASLSGEVEKYIPGPLTALLEVIDESEPKPITDELAAQVLEAMKTPNKSIYQGEVDGPRGVTSPEKVKQFLEEHQGRLLLPISG